MANTQNELTVHAFTNENVLRRSEQTITSLKISNSGKSVISEFIQEKISRSELPFPNVEKLCFYNGYFNNDITQYISHLSKLKVLEFERTTVENRKCIERNFPTLKQLSLVNNLVLENGSIFLINDVKRAIELNPQLEGIKFRCDALNEEFPIGPGNVLGVIQLLRFINDKLQNLNYLGLYFSVDNYNKVKPTIVFKNVSRAMLFVEAYNFVWGPTSINFPIAFQRLIELELSSYDIYTDDCVDFAMKNQLLEKLKLKFSWISESDGEEDCLNYEILYEEDEQVDVSAIPVEDDEDENDDEDNEDEDDEDEDDERMQYECYLKPFIKLTKSLPNLKELSIGPITKFDGEDIMKILSPGKALNKLHIKLRYPLNHCRTARYAGIKKLEAEMESVLKNVENWNAQVEFKLRPGSETEFRIANFVFQRHENISDSQ